MKEVTVTLSVHEGPTDNLRDCVFSKRLFEEGWCLFPTPGQTTYKVVLQRDQGKDPQDTAEETSSEVEASGDLFGKSVPSTAPEVGSPAEVYGEGD